MPVSFRGRFETKLDPKGRLTLPAALRGSLEGGEIFITNSLHQGLACLDLYNLGAWNRLEERIQKLPAFHSEVQTFSRFYLSGGQIAEIDGQNRFLIPQSLRSYAQLDADVVLVGMADKLEIWSAHLWNRVFKNLTLHFDSTIAKLAEIEKSGAA